MPRLLLTAVVLAVLAAAAVLVLRAATDDANDGGDGPPAAASCAVTLRHDGLDYVAVPPDAVDRFTTGTTIGSGTHPLGCDPADDEGEPVDVLAIEGVDPAEAVAGAIALDGASTMHVWIRGPRCARAPSLDELATCLRTQPAAPATDTG